MSIKIEKNSETLIHKYFEKEILKDKELRNILIAFEELLNIKKNIRKIFQTDDPEKIKNLIGKEINNNIVKEKDYEYALLIDKTYKQTYSKCKKALKNKNDK